MGYLFPGVGFSGIRPVFVNDLYSNMEQAVACESSNSDNIIIIVSNIIFFVNSHLLL
jgi:hypothetical protein